MAAAPGAQTDDLVEQAFDAKQHDALAEAISQLTPEEAQFFLDKLETAHRRRRLQAIGYLVAMFVWIIGMLAAFGGYALLDGPMRYGVFLVPLFAVGVVLYVFGRWSNAARARKPRVP